MLPSTKRKTSPTLHSERRFLKHWEGTRSNCKRGIQNKNWFFQSCYPIKQQIYIYIYNYIIIYIYTWKRCKCWVLFFILECCRGNDDVHLQSGDLLLIVCRQTFWVYVMIMIRNFNGRSSLRADVTAPTCSTKSSKLTTKPGECLPIWHERNCSEIICWNGTHNDL